MSAADVETGCLGKTCRPCTGCLGEACRVCADNPAIKFGACGLMSLLTVVSAIVFICSIHTLAPDDQVLIQNHGGNVVVNGPGTKILNPFREKVWRKASLLGPLEYARVQDALTGFIRHVEGPTKLFLQAYDELKGIHDKIVLNKDEYIKLIDGGSGTERVLKGPQTLVPMPSETSREGKQRAVFLDTDSAALIVDRTSGLQSLVRHQGVFFPGPYQQVLEVRPLIHVLPHEAIVERDPSGNYIIHNGGTSFFLQPYHALVTMAWSSYSDPLPQSVHAQSHRQINVTKIDMRARLMFFSYEVRTSDNVKLQLEGNIFWRVLNVGKMMDTTSDPEGEVWQHARSAFIQGVSKSKLSDFMENFNNISAEAAAQQASDGFYADRGVEVISMEVTRFEPVESQTAEVLQQIIQETTNRINRLQKQNSENDVLAAKLAADIKMEKDRTELIETQAKNFQLEAQMQGESSGQKRARGAAAFINGLNASLPNVTTRVELYKLHETLENNRANTENLAAGKATLFLTPKDMNLKLHMGSGTEL